jgi:hypothetical protein
MDVAVSWYSSHLGSGGNQRFFLWILDMAGLCFRLSSNTERGKSNMGGNMRKRNLNSGTRAGSKPEGIRANGENGVELDSISRCAGVTRVTME